MQMKLYYNPRSRAAIAKWMLDECGVDYEIVPIDFKKRQHKAPEFLKINPAGKLPALVDGDSRIFEGAAICLYLGDKFPQARLAPQIGSPERGRYLSLMVYSTSQLEPAMGDALLNAQHLPQRGWTDFETVKDVIEGRAGRRTVSARRLVHRRRCDDRLHVHLEANVGRPSRSAQARSLCGSSA
jgi:glutathione S-transferase